MIISLYLIQIQTHQIHYLYYHLLKTLLQICMVYKLLIRMQIHRQNTILLLFITPQRYYLSHRILLQTSHRNSLNYRFFFQKSLNNPLLSNQTRNLVFSKCTKNRLRIKILRPQFLPQCLRFFTISSNKNHIRSILFNIKFQVFTTHKLLQLNIISNNSLECMERFTRLINKSNSQFRIL